MFTRMLEFTPKPDKIQQFTHMIDHDVLPILKKYPDFVDMMTLTPEDKNHHFIVMSFWKTKEMAQEYHKKDYPRIMEMIKPFVNDTPKITFFMVETSTFHKIAVAA